MLLLTCYDVAKGTRALVRVLLCYGALEIVSVIIIIIIIMIGLTNASHIL